MIDIEEKQDDNYLAAIHKTFSEPQKEKQLREECDQVLKIIDRMESFWSEDTKPLLSIMLCCFVLRRNIDALKGLSSEDREFGPTLDRIRLHLKYLILERVSGLSAEEQEQLEQLEPLLSE